MYQQYLTQFSNLQIKQFEEVQKALDDAREAKKQEAVSALREEFTNKAAVLGVDPSELLGKEKKTKASRKPVTPKYRLTEADGTVHEWSGRGLSPRAFQQYSKEQLGQFLIK